MTNKKLNPYPYKKGQTFCIYRDFDKVKIGDDRCYNCNQLVSISMEDVTCKKYGKETK